MPSSPVQIDRESNVLSSAAHRADSEASFDTKDVDLAVDVLCLVDNNTVYIDHPDMTERALRECMLHMAGRRKAVT